MIRRSIGALLAASLLAAVTMAPFPLRPLKRRSCIA